MMKYLLGFAVLLFFTACSSIDTIEYAKVRDLQTLPQRADVYAKNVQTQKALLPVQQGYDVSYFRPWDSNITASLYNIQWPFRAYNDKNSYGLNLKPLTCSWFYKMYANANYGAYATLNKHAITVRYLSLHNFPTDEPIFRDPRDAGEGFPFDYNQNSGVDADKPVIVSHYSQDRAWVYIFTSYASGWVHSYDIAYISQDDINAWKKAQHIHVTADIYPLIDKNGNFICYSRVGMMLPLVGKTQEGYTVQLAVRDSNGSAIFKNAFIPNTIATEDILNITPKNVTSIANEIIQSKYGWGGLYAQRDCSSTVRDFFAPFGIWMPRNSWSQGHVGKVISLRGLSNTKKLEKIQKEGIPFQTLLYKPGHILIYAGTYHGKVIVLQNLWGIKIKKNDKTGRVIVGKVAFTTLKVGEHVKYFDPAQSLVHRIVSMNIITQ
jgi:hypothetical protein